MTRYFPARVTRSGAGYVIAFPDLPGCESQGVSFHDLSHRAGALLAAHLDALRDAGGLVPEPSSIKALEDAIDREGTSYLLVAAQQAGQSSRVEVSLPDDLLRAIDALGTDRASFIAVATRRAIDAIARPRANVVRRRRSTRVVAAAAMH
ncbi:type II toxin-antitoxin system HicB family antitoxin [Allosphingosinicella indica]|uniref:Predicted nuclease of the RNAse H fold, HicB family n=1 Tax=Allosphingosinicella indica TaxID=941907 RepID=A0A1X7GKB5_9SPHN|nr:type II toxin-antitoxin system HicB family antitoxin [Allosphingosinicella indica]SMF70348.1 Predicted nuclease of the RNAse H fold, HicB family [Allosphingosinicella indica]